MISLSTDSGYTVEPWSSHHKGLRSNFDCGNEDLNLWLKNRASQDVDKRTCALFVVQNSNKDAIVGFYTLSMYSIHLTAIPCEIQRKLPKYPFVPSILLGRLAVDLNFRGKRIGEFLLVDAMSRALDSVIPWWAMVVDSKKDSLSFYLKYGFCPFKDEKHKLFLPYKTILRAFEESMAKGVGAPARANDSETRQK